MSENILELNDYGKVEVEWDVLPGMYSREEEERVKTLLSEKYQIPVNKITVRVNTVANAKGEGMSELSSDTIRDVRNQDFQIGLYKKWLKTNGYNLSDEEMQKILAFDSRINTLLDDDSYKNVKNYKIKWVECDNFLSFGNIERFDFTNLKGLVSIVGNPQNTAGKTTFAFDLIYYALYGKLKSGKGERKDEIFNKFLPDSKTSKVRCCIQIDSCDYIIERILTKGKNQPKNEVHFYKITSDGQEILTDNLEETSTINTNQMIIEAIGSEDDFELSVFANSDNLKNIIRMSENERGRMLTRWIGLQPIMDKCEKAKEVFKSEATHWLSGFDVATLKEEITTCENEINLSASTISECEVRLEETDTTITTLNADKEKLLASKIPIDESLMKEDIPTLEAKGQQITDEGKRLKLQLDENRKALAGMGDVVFDEMALREEVTRERECDNFIRSTKQAIEHCREDILKNTNSGKCPTCGKPLDNADHEHIRRVNAELEAKINEYSQAVAQQEANLVIFRQNIAYYEGLREQAAAKEKLELTIDSQVSRIENLRTQYQHIRNTMKQLVANQQTIIENNKIDADINVKNASIAENKKIYNGIADEISALKANIAVRNNKIKDNNGYIARIKEEEVEKNIWNIYLKLLGKDGISKLVLQETLPRVNEEVSAYLSGVCDFTVVAEIDEKNNVYFYIQKGEFRQLLTSGSGFEQTVAAICLRMILGNLNTCSRPDFLILDEVLVGVGIENYPKIKVLYDKLKEHYSYILHICHDQEIQQWGDMIINIEKKNNISTVHRAEKLNA